MKSRSDDRVIELLLARGPLDRPALAELTGLSRPSTGELITRLINAGLVEEDGEIPTGRRGPNAMRYRLRRGCGTVVGLEIQPDHAEAVLADVDGTELERIRVKARRNERPATLVRRAVRGFDGADRLQAVVVATPGIVDRQGNVVFVSDHPHWAGPQGARLTEALGVPVVLENDTNLAGVAEHRYGAAADSDDFVLLRFTESLSAALVLDGRLVRGANGAAGEIGFHPYQRTAAEVIGQLTEAAIALCAVADPELVVLSGPQASAEVAEAVAEQVAATSLFRPRVVPSALPDGAAVRGALALALDRGRDKVYFNEELEL
ncbi:ROK family protein [Microlunatus sp. GCM10028923]|uniref:ROK family transcriptional regulator n=1 Tax=Microlunatus sp. GCM10028923 TaxID=3273400 RepID=UPI00361635D7